MTVGTAKAHPHADLSDLDIFVQALQDNIADIERWPGYDIGKAVSQAWDSVTYERDQRARNAAEAARILEIGPS